MGRQWAAVVAGLVALGCAGGSGDDADGKPSDSGATGGTTPPDDTSDTDEPEGFPEAPDPFTISVSGAWSGTLTFDTPSCSHRTGSATFRQFWRGPDHAFVLLVEMFDTFPGEPGDYTGADGVRARLQEEAGGDGNYFDSQLGDASSTLRLEGLDTELSQAWGTATAGTLGDGTGGTVTLSPDSLRVWCDHLE